MAPQPPIKQTLTQRSMVIKEEYTPAGAGRPRTPSPTGRQRSPAPERDLIQFSPQTPPGDRDLIQFSPDAPPSTPTGRRARFQPGSPVSPPRAYSPESPPSGKSPLPPTFKGDVVVGELVQTLCEFQQTCGEVIQSLSSIVPQERGSPRTPRTASPASPRTASPASPRGRSPDSPGGPRTPTNTNLVKPTLDDIFTLVQFGSGQFLEDRNRYMNDLQYSTQRSLNAVNDAKNKVMEFEAVVDRASEFIPDIIEMWGGYGEYFTSIYEASVDPENPIPNLDAIKHPSPNISQRDYSELVRQIISMCHESEREMRLTHGVYSTMEDYLDYVRKSLDKFTEDFMSLENITVIALLDYQKLSRMFGEKRQRVDAFLMEWQKGGDQLNQPLSPPSPKPRIPQLSPCAAVHPGPSSLDSTTDSSLAEVHPGPSSLDSTTDSSLAEQEERVKTLQRKTHMIEEIIQRYNDLHGSMLHEARSIRNQNEVLEQSKTAMEDIPEGKGTPPPPPPTS